MEYYPDIYEIEQHVFSVFSFCFWSVLLLSCGGVRCTCGQHWTVENGTKGPHSWALTDHLSCRRLCIAKWGTHMRMHGRNVGSLTISAKYLCTRPLPTYEVARQEEPGDFFTRNLRSTRGRKMAPYVRSRRPAIIKPSDFWEVLLVAPIYLSAIIFLGSLSFISISFCFQHKSQRHLVRVFKNSQTKFSKEDSRIEIESFFKYNFIGSACKGRDLTQTIWLPFGPTFWKVSFNIEYELWTLGW